MQTNGKSTCDARTRSGGKCQNSPMPNGRCRMHGGKSLKGTDSKRYSHGLYSKYAGQSLKSVLEELNNVSSDELIEPEQEIRLMSALIMKCKAIENGADELKDLDTISKILERLIHAKQRSQAIMIEQSRLVPVTDIEMFLDWMETLLTSRIGDEQGNEIISEMKNFKLESHENYKNNL